MVRQSGWGLTRTRALPDSGEAKSPRYVFEIGDRNGKTLLGDNRRARIHEPPLFGGGHRWGKDGLYLSLGLAGLNLTLFLVLGL